jgi:heme/copper-type cytochrome/quinol oxidase subunit 2
MQMKNCLHFDYTIGGRTSITIFLTIIIIIIIIVVAVVVVEHLFNEALSKILHTK